MDQQATAIAIAVSMLSVSLAAAVPVQAAISDRCDDDFDLASSELLATSRSLSAAETKVGQITLDSTDSDEVLHVDLLTDNKQLDYHVFRDDGSCDDFADQDTACEGTITTDSADPDTECTMTAPSSGSVTYYANFWNNGTESLNYKTWAG